MAIGLSRLRGSTRLTSTNRLRRRHNAKADVIPTHVGGYASLGALGGRNGAPELSTCKVVFIGAELRAHIS